jgi:hypothetical protein
VGRRKAEFIVGEVEPVERENASFRRFDITTEKEGYVGSLYIPNNINLNPKRVLFKEVDVFIKDTVW